MDCSYLDRMFRRGPPTDLEVVVPPAEALMAYLEKEKPRVEEVRKKMERQLRVSNSMFDF